MFGKHLTIGLKRSVIQLCLVTFSLLLLFLAIGCSGGKIEKLETDTKRDVNDIRSLQAQLNASLSELRAELRELRGKVEELEYTSVGKTRELERTLRQFGSRVPPPEGVPADLLNRDEERIVKNSGPAAELYRRGLTSVRAGDFQGAVQTMRQFVEQNPDTAFSDNALFWMGVSLEKMGRYGDAIASYNDVMVRYPAEDMVPASLFRLGESFAKMGSVKDAMLTFDKLMDEYPKNQFSSRAKKRKRELRRRR